jgi:hypothetical protein
MLPHEFLHKHPILNLLHDSECDCKKQIKKKCRIEIVQFIFIGRTNSTNDLITWVIISYLIFS